MKSAKMEVDFTVIDQGSARTIAAVKADGAVKLAPGAVEEALSWAMKPEGLCRGEVCIPTGGHPELFDGELVDLENLAGLLRRPIAIGEDAAYVGSPFHGAVHDGEVEFTLPDFDGRIHHLSEYRGQKVLLAVWASW